MYACMHVRMYVYTYMYMDELMYVCIYVRTNVKVKQSHYSSGQAQGVPGG
jgi:hypothetical protein